MTGEIELAEKVARKMYLQDNASRSLGFVIDEVRPGFARLSMTVRGDMVNGHKLCHGGIIFTLADSAFAFACNSYNQSAVAQHNDITFCAPGRLGDVLTAKAVEVTKTGRSGVYDVTVTNQDGIVIAVMRGNSRTIKGSHFDEEETDG